MSAPDQVSPPDAAAMMLPRRCAAACLVLAAVLGAGSALRLFASGLRNAPPPERAMLRLNPNQAAAEELALLPGIGPQLAGRIVAHRQTAATPVFRDAEDLRAVPGVGPATVASLRSMLRFDPPEETARAD